MSDRTTTNSDSTSRYCNRLREALDRYDAVLPASSRPDALNTVLAAARRFLALTETGQRVEWCATHDDQGFFAPRACQIGASSGDYGNCRIISKFLSDIPADYLTEEETK